MTEHPPFLRPLFSYMGSKSLNSNPRRLKSADSQVRAQTYPSPLHKVIIEPFAGSAGYSLSWYHERKVILHDKYEAIVILWEFLLSTTPQYILSIPDDPLVHKDLEPGAEILVGYWNGRAQAEPVAAPKKRTGSWSPQARPESYWGPTVKQRIASQLPLIQPNWRIRRGTYAGLPRVIATWFIDPPYQHQGHQYAVGSESIDYKMLAEWVLSLPGQVIVCEGAGADWLPFKKFRPGRRHQGTGRKQCDELIWYREARPTRSVWSVTSSLRPKK